MKVRFNRWYNTVLTALLSMLGYSCSSSDSDEPEFIAEYGAPYADFIFKGQVTDEVGTPIQNIKTSLKNTFQIENERYVYCIDSVQSGVSGDYQLKYSGMLNQDNKIIVEDVDGEANGGEFLSDTLDIDFDKAVKTKEGHHWYQGTYEISQDVKLKKK
jgi:putative lipoprotein (rSAM/lipoprotein system)